MCRRLCDAVEDRTYHTASGTLAILTPQPLQQKLVLIVGHTTYHGKVNCLQVMTATTSTTCVTLIGVLS